MDEALPVCKYADSLLNRESVPVVVSANSGKFMCLSGCCSEDYKPNSEQCKFSAAHADE